MILSDFMEIVCPVLFGLFLVAIILGSVAQAKGKISEGTLAAIGFLFGYPLVVSGYIYAMAICAGT